MSALLRRRKEVPQQISRACSNCRTGAAARSSTCALCSTQIYRFLQGPFLFRMLFSIEQQWQAMAVTCTCKCLEVSWSILKYLDVLSCGWYLKSIWLGDVGRCASGLDAAESASRGWKQRTVPKRQTLVACFNMFQHVSTLSLNIFKES
jgi:hypothetical protein